MKIKELLKIKERPLITIDPDETVLAAIQKSAENNIGALPVCETKGEMLGIVTERDLLKECAQRSNSIGKTKIKDIMTKDVVVGVPDDDLEYSMGVMTKQKIRHLPIIAWEKLDNIISMRDIVEARLDESQWLINRLDDYIVHGSE